MKRFDDRVAAAARLPGGPEVFCPRHHPPRNALAPLPRLFAAAAAAAPAAVLLLCLSAVWPAGCNKADQTSSPAKPATAYVANSGSRIVHRADCKYAAKIKPDHRVEFRDLPNALAEAYRPCKSCLPSAIRRVGPATQTGRIEE